MAGGAGQGAGVFFEEVQGCQSFQGAKCPPLSSKSCNRMMRQRQGAHVGHNFGRGTVSAAHVTARMGRTSVLVCQELGNVPRLGTFSAKPGTVPGTLDSWSCSWWDGWTHCELVTQVFLKVCGLPGPWPGFQEGEHTLPDSSSPPCLSVAEPEPQCLCQLCKPQRYQGECPDRPLGVGFRLWRPSSSLQCVTPSSG